jgi:YD repeat-containing protein
MSLATRVAPAAVPAIANHEPSKGTFVLRVLDKDVGRETFEILPDGWRTQGSYDLFGQQRGDFDIEERRAAGTTTISGQRTAQGRDQPFEATLGHDQLECRVAGGPPSTLAFWASPRLFRTKT